MGEVENRIAITDSVRGVGFDCPTKRLGGEAGRLVSIRVSDRCRSGTFELQGKPVNWILVPLKQQPVEGDR